MNLPVVRSFLQRMYKFFKLPGVDHLLMSSHEGNVEVVVR